MKAAAELKRKINAEEIVTGLLCTDHVWPLLVEICQKAGVDYLIVDSEHGPPSDQLVADICQLGRVLGFPILRRVVSTDEAVLRRALDMGPCGLLIPCVETVDQLDCVRDCAWMPPRGRRRPGGLGNYWMRDFNYTTWRDEYENDLIIIPQIESMKGVENAAALAAHEVVTALGVGPYDLSADIGCCWDPDNAEWQAALQRIRQAGRAVGKNMWMGMGGKSLVDKGYTFLCLGDPGFLLGNAMKGIDQEAKGHAPAKGPVDEMPRA